MRQLFSGPNKILFEMRVEWSRRPDRRGKKKTKEKKELRLKGKSTLPLFFILEVGATKSGGGGGG